jgi:alkanesulfonate monooxygenase SsuD/methylene tetrahydromethanopterin reductase-like flavin-dependent oxidoreductase (luciferase family)
MAAATSRVALMTATANNLVRSPVETAQAAITLNELSNGRFALGLGAGWHRNEIEAMGIDFPSPRARAERYVAAITIVRDLFSTGRSVGDGRHYHVDIDLERRPQDPPPLYGAVAGPWVTRHVAPLVDRVEVLPFPQTSNTGALRPAEIANIDRDAIRREIDAVKQHAPSTPVSLLLFIAVGTTEELAPYRPSFVSPFAAGLCGSADVVAANLQGLADLGIDDVTIMPLTTNHEDELATCLLG